MTQLPVVAFRSQNGQKLLTHVRLATPSAAVGEGYRSSDYRNERRPAYCQHQVAEQRERDAVNNRSIGIGNDVHRSDKHVKHVSGELQSEQETPQGSVGIAAL